MKSNRLMRAFHNPAPTGKGNTVNWKEIAGNLPGRSNKDCRKRYLNEMAGTLKKVSRHQALTEPSSSR